MSKINQMTIFSDEHFMEQALHLATKGRLEAPPNPWVGCVIVKEGNIIGQGRTQKPGGNHAEVDALENAKSQNRQVEDATVYVTLEPCSHTGKTGPCVDRLIEAKVKRVVIALMDPDVNVRGKGILKLKEAGIEVTFGVLSEQAERILEPYLHHRTFSRPFILVKSAISVDGQTAAFDGSSQWISTKEAREDSHKLRARSQAIMIGSSTAINDSPALTVRDVSQPLIPPLRVILDGRGRTQPLPIKAPTLVVSAKRTKNSDLWEKDGAEILIANAGNQGKGVNLQEVFEFLGKRGVLQVLIEGGGEVLTSLLEEKLIDQLTLYVGPCLLGNRAFPLFPGFFVPSIKEAKPLHLKQIMQLGQTVRLDYSM